MKSMKTSTGILVGIFAFLIGYWGNEYLNRRYYRDESLRTFMRAIQIGQEKGYLTVHYEMLEAGDNTLPKELSEPSLKPECTSLTEK